MKLSDYDLSSIDSMRDEVDALLKELFPINRSITGDGVRETYRILQRVAPFYTAEIPSGSQCYDWTVPDEWVIREAFVETEAGERILDFKQNNLHVLNYSSAVDDLVSFEELAKHLHTLPDLPDAIPYRTSYYKKNWGFCLSHNQFEKLDRNLKYRVLIDSEHKPGSLTLGDYWHGCSSMPNYLISTYSCHPSLANDNLSGMVLWVLLLRIIQSVETKYNYRFCIWPETIGAITYLSVNETDMKDFSGGFVITTVGGNDTIGYKKTFLGDSRIDEAVFSAFDRLGISPLLYSFEPIGSDERQLSSPAFRIPVGTITKGKYGEYPYYHTSLDNLDFVKAENILETLKVYVASLQELEKDDGVFLKSNLPHCEPNLGKRGLYPTTGGAINTSTITYADLDLIRWVLFLADGTNSLFDIQEKSGFALADIKRIAKVLVEKGLVHEG